MPTIYMCTCVRECTCGFFDASLYIIEDTCMPICYSIRNVYVRGISNRAWTSNTVELA